MRGFTGLLLLVLLFLVLSFRQGIALYVDWLWFQEVGYTQLFATTLLYKFILAVLAGGLLSALLYLNLKIAAVAPAGFRFSRADNVIELPSPDLIDPPFRRLLLPASLFLGLLAAPQGAMNWERLPLFLNATSFNLHRSFVRLRHWVLPVPSTDVFGSLRLADFRIGNNPARDRGSLFPLSWNSVWSSRACSFPEGENAPVDSHRPHSALQGGWLPVGLL